MENQNYGPFFYSKPGAMVEYAKEMQKIKRYIDNIDKV